MYSYISLKQFIDVSRYYLDYDSEFIVTILRIIFLSPSALKKSYLIRLTSRSSGTRRYVIVDTITDKAGFSQGVLKPAIY